MQKDKILERIAKKLWELRIHTIKWAEEVMVWEQVDGGRRHKVDHEGSFILLCLCTPKDRDSH